MRSAIITGGRKMKTLIASLTLAACVYADDQPIGGCCSQVTRANQPLSVAGTQQETYVGTERRLLTALKEAEKLGLGDRRLPAILSNLGAFYKGISKPAEAEKFYLRSLAVREKIGGANHSSLAEPLVSLVALYLENGTYSRAERLHRRMMAVLPGLVPGDPDSASLLHNFAAIYYVQRKYSEAEPLYYQALASFEKAFGPGDREVGLVLNNLAMLKNKMGRQEEAVSYFQQALVIWETAFGPNDPHVARGLVNLAGLYCFLGRYADAEPLFQRALAIAENTLG